VVANSLVCSEQKINRRCLRRIQPPNVCEDDIDDGDLIVDAGMV
jgi:hypothetical protein